MTTHLTGRTVRVLLVVVGGLLSSCGGDVEGAVWIQPVCDSYPAQAQDEAPICAYDLDDDGTNEYLTKPSGSFKLGFTDDVEPEDVASHLTWETPETGGEPLFEVIADPLNENAVIVALTDWRESCGSISPGSYYCGVFTLSSEFTAVNSEPLGRSEADAPEDLQIILQGLD